MPSGEIPLTFDRWAHWPLEREPVTVGVPFPPAALGSAAEARLFDGDEELYCQRQVLNTWPDGSVRWLLIDAQVDLPAAAPKTLRLVYGQGASQAALDDTGISLSEERGGFILDTGPLRVECIARPLRLFQTVHLGAAEILGAKDAADFRLVDLSGKAFAASACKLPSVSVEASGPLRAAIRIQGSHDSENGQPFLDFDLLLTAWSGKPWVALDYQIIHRGGDEAAELHEAAFDITFAGREACTFQMGAGGRMGRAEGLAVERTGSSLTIDIPREPASAFGPSPWLSRSGEGRGVALGVRHALEQFPKRLIADGERLAVELYPPGDAPLRLHQGMAKGHELLVHFHAGEADGVALARRFHLLELAPRPRLPAEWYQEARAFGTRLPTRSLCTVDVALDEALDRRPRAAGIVHFGDEPRTTKPLVWNNNACDLAYACLLQYARTGAGRHFAAAEAIVRHVIDVDHVHFSPDPLRDGALAAPSIDHVADGRAGPAHQWVEGLLAWHALTGSQPALHTVRRVGENLLRHVPALVEASPPRTDYEAVGWALYTVATLYRELGRTQYFDAARKLVDHLAKCAAGGDRATCTCAAQCGPGRPCTVAVVLTGIQRYHRVSKEGRAGDLFLHELDAVLAGGTDGLWRHTCLTRPEPDLQADALLLEPLAFAFELTGDARYLELGRPLVRHLLSGGLRVAAAPVADRQLIGDALIARPRLIPATGLAIAQVIRPLLAYLAVAESAGRLDALGLG